MTLAALPTVDVECIARTSTGAPIAGAVFAFQLDRADRYQGFVVPQRVLVTADADGRAVAKVFPNALGSAGSVYQVEGSYPGTPATPARRFLQGLARVAQAGRLDDVLFTEKLPDLGPVLTALRQLQAASGQIAADRQASQAAATLVQLLLAGIGGAGLALHEVNQAAAAIALAPGINVIGVRYQGGPVTLTLSAEADAYYIANLEGGAPGPVIPVYT